LHTLQGMYPAFITFILVLKYTMCKNLSGSCIYMCLDGIGVGVAYVLMGGWNVDSSGFRFFLNLSNLKLILTLLFIKK